jgi:regulator of protease activity HflC (stomatin/prohibitin superfamily)
MSKTVFSTSKNEQPSPFKPSWAIIGVVAFVLILVIINCFTIVNEGYIGVKYQFGKIVQDDINPGLRFKIPFVEEIKQVDIKHQIYEFNGDAFTKDTQRVIDLRLKLTYRYDRARLRGIIRDTGISQVQDKFLVPNVQKWAKDAIGKVNAESLVQERDRVQSEIQVALTSVLAEHGIIVVEFAIENIAFLPEFEQSIQDKVVQEQRALQKKNQTAERQEEAEQVRIAAQAEADRIRIEAEAEAQAIALIQEQITQNRQYIEYLKIIQWNGILPQVIGEGVNPFVVLDSGSGSSE